MPTTSFAIPTRGQGLREITDEVHEAVRTLRRRHPGDPSLCTIFVRHTSASLVIQENADPSAARDLEAFLDRLAPEGDPRYTHTAEGPDDMPSHIRAALTATSLGVPMLEGALTLGTWQGIFLWEHRNRPHRREVVVAVT